MVGDARAYGRIHDISVADIRAAIDADRAKHHDKIYEIEVVNADEVRLYLQRRVDPDHMTADKPPGRPPSQLRRRRWPPAG